MTLAQAERFYKKYEGLMTDDEIFAETGFSAERIREQIIKNKGQLCWTCANACDDTKCEWVFRCNGVQGDVRVNDYPNYVTTQKVHDYKRHNTEYVVACERYVDDSRV